jgi:hypothetical protein
MHSIFPAVNEVQPATAGVAKRALDRFKFVVAGIAVA